MKHLEITLPAQDGKPERIINFQFGHPWREVSFRGSRANAKCTTCTAAELISPETDTEKAKYKYINSVLVKWPLIAPIIGGVVQKDHSITTLPKEPLSKTNGCKTALKRLFERSSKETFTYADRSLIWYKFHQAFRTGVVPSVTEGNGGGAATLAPADEAVTVKATFGGLDKSNPGVMMMSTFSWPQAENRTIH